MASFCESVMFQINYLATRTEKPFFVWHMELSDRHKDDVIVLGPVDSLSVILFDQIALHKKLAWFTIP